MASPSLPPPEVVVLSAAYLAADDRAGRGVEKLILLSATPAGDGRIRLQARTPSGANREAEVSARCSRRTSSTRPATRC